MSEASLEVIRESCLVGRYRVAEAVYEIMANGRNSRDFLQYRTRAAVFLMNSMTCGWTLEPTGQKEDLTPWEKLDLARRVFSGMDGLVGQGPEDTEWGGALVNFVSALETAGHSDEAETVYLAIPQLGRRREVLLEWAKAAFNRITFRAEAGRLDEAVSLLAAMEEQGRTEIALLYRAQAAVNVISSLGQAGRLKEALELYEKAQTFGHGSQISLNRAKMLYNVILGYIKDGRSAEAARLFTRFKPGPELKEVNPCLVQVAMELLMDMAENNRLEEARAIHKTMSQILSGQGLSTEWPTFEQMMLEQPAARAGGGKLSVSAIGKLKDTVLDLLKRHLTGEFKEFVGQSLPLTGRRGDGEGRSNLKPWLVSAPFKHNHS
jgi:pentatricopeptide repeat protein